MSSFLEKYAPKQVCDFAGQKLAISSLISFIENPGKKKAVILYGLPGTGKTSSVYVIAKELNCEIVELNSDELRDKNRLDDVLGNTINTASIFGKKKIVLLDEIESLNSSALNKVMEFIKKSRIPIILIAIDIWEQKFKFLRLCCEKIEYKKINSRSIANKLKQIVDFEDLPFDAETIENLSKNASGDMRAAIIDLETAAAAKKFNKENYFSNNRTSKKNVFEAVQKIFKSEFSTELIDLFEEAGLDVHTGVLWLAENICKDYKKPIEISGAFNFLSRSDVFMGRITKRQYWRFQYYAKVLSIAGVNLSKNGQYFGFSKYEFPSKLLKLSESKSQRSNIKNIGKKIAPKLHISSKIFVKDYLAMFKIMLKKEPSLNKTIQEYGGLTPGELNYLAE